MASYSIVIVINAAKLLTNTILPLHTTLTTISSLPSRPNRWLYGICGKETLGKFTLWGILWWREVER